MFFVGLFGMGLLENSVLCCRGLMAQLLQLPFSFRVAVVGMQALRCQDAKHFGADITFMVQHIFDTVRNSGLRV